jgi:hypothetical protein
MTIIVHSGVHEHQQIAAAQMAAGLGRHGLAVRWNEHRPCDIAIVWGGRQRERVVGEAGHVLVMERGHVGDRMTMTSCGWDGLARRGHYPRATDGGARWRARYGELMQPWTERDGYALVIGQVDGDAALGGLDVARWREETERELVRLGWRPVFRPHPVVSRPKRPLAADLRGAALCVTYNSTTGVEAVLAGVPTVTLDAGAMAWPVASHRLGDPASRPEREPWAHDLAWAQWSLDEIASGETWAHLGPLIPGLV